MLRHLCIDTAAFFRRDPSFSDPFTASALTQCLAAERSYHPFPFLCHEVHAGTVPRLAADAQPIAIFAPIADRGGFPMGLSWSDRYPWQLLLERWAKKSHNVTSSLP